MNEARCFSPIAVGCAVRVHLLAGGPFHLTATQNMNMKMVNTLSSLRMCVDHKAKPLASNPFLFRDAPSKDEHFTKQSLRSL